MATKKIGSSLPLQWFKDRIGKEIYAASSTYNGRFKIEDESHASYLCSVSQSHFKMRFSDIEKKESQKNN